MANNNKSSGTAPGSEKSWNDFWRAALEIIWSHTRRLTSKLFAIARKTKLPGNGSGFVEVDAASVCSEFEIGQLAISDAERNEPRTSEEAPSGAQLEIINYFRYLRRRAAQKIASLNKRTRALRNQIDFTAELESLRTIETHAENNIVRLNASRLSRLELLNERETQQQQHYETFREENRLDRVAEDPISTLFLFAFVAALVGIGAVAMSRLSGIGPDGVALLQPASAIAISFAVVIIPLMLGAAVFPQINHLSDIKQFFGLAGGIAAIIVIGSAAMLAARFVSAAAIDPSVSWPTVMEAWRQAPFEFALEGSSLMVLGVVCLLGLLAFLVGYRSNDPYPGYGNVQRSYYRARREREMLANRVRGQIDNVVDDADIEVAKLLQALKTRVKRYESLATEAGSAPDAFSSYVERLEDTCSIVIDRYRRANERARSTDAPSYFYENDSMVADDHEMASLRDDAAHPLAEVLKGMEDFETQIGRSRRRLQDLNWRAAELLEASSLSNTDRGEGERHVAPA